MSEPDATSGPQTGGRVAIGAGIVAALLGVGATVLDKLPLRTAVLCIALVLVAVLTALAHALLTSRGQRRTRLDQANRLREWLSAWPLSSTGDVSAYAIGVRSPAASVAPGPLPVYVGRDIDEDVHDALALGAVVLLVGPACAGKSRTAFEGLATNERTKDAGLIAPDDGKALAELLRNPQWVTKPGEHYVLWLDDLERYVDHLELRRLDAFVRAAEPRRLNGHDVCGVVVVATLREDLFLSIFAEGGNRAHALRGFIARAERIMVPEKLSSEEQQRLQKHYPTAPEGDSFGEVFGATMLQLGHPFYSPPLPRPPTRARRHALSPVGAVMLLLALAVVLFLVGQGSGWVNPPPLVDRFNALDTATDDPCGGSGLSPKTAGAVRQDLVRVVHKADGCPESDVVEVYKREGSTIAAHRAFALQVAAEQKAQFRCLGPDSADACHPDVIGGKHFIVGVWVDVVSGRRMPVVISRNGDRYVPDVIDLPPPKTAARASSTVPALARPAESVTVTDQVSHREWKLEGSPVQDAVMLPPQGEHGATLLAAYVVGKRLSSTQVVGRAFELRLKQGNVAVSRTCDGKQARVLRFTVTDNGDIVKSLKRRWVRAATAGRVSCSLG